MPPKPTAYGASNMNGVAGEDAEALLHRAQRRRRAKPWFLGARRYDTWGWQSHAALIAAIAALAITGTAITRTRRASSLEDAKMIGDAAAGSSSVSVSSSDGGAASSGRPTPTWSSPSFTNDDVNNSDNATADVGMPMNAHGREKSRWPSVKRYFRLHTGCLQRVIDR